MKRYLVPTAVLLLLGTILGQSSPSPFSKPSNNNLGTVIQAAQENAPSQQNQQMLGMQMPDNPQPQRQQQTPTGHEQMPGMQMPQAAEQQDLESKPGLTYTLEQLQQLAVDHNPTLKQAQAEIRAAEARKRQAGLYPNPTVGYIGEQISGGPQRGGEQGAFVQQDIVLGGKLGAARRVAEQERLQAETERGEQLLRVQNAVAIAYYQSLGAQQTVAIREKLLQLAQDAVSTANQLYNIGQADEPDVLQAQVETGQEEIAVGSSRQRLQMFWRSLAAVVGQPTLPFGQLAGSLENVPDVDTQQWLENILENSPAVKISSLSLARAQAELDRAKREPIPDLQIRAGIQQNRELLETTGRPVGLQGLAEVGVRIPIFNRNQGNIEAAKANIERADLEQQRVQLLLRERSSSIFQTYFTAKAAVERYKTRMIPQAEKAYQLYLARYRNMGAAYPQVLIAQRTLFQLQTDYISSLESLWVSTVTLKGFLLSDGLEAPTPPTEVDRPVRETNLPTSTGTSQAR
jgi:outer membrane protein, heavy metal efflux system